MQSLEEFLGLWNDTWNKRLGLNTTRVHDELDALFGYDSMWLAALAMDMAEARLQNMTPSLTLGDFNYTGNDSIAIKNAIYSSGLEVSFTGASVSSGLHKHTVYNITYYALPIHMYVECKHDAPYCRALSSSSPMATDLQSCDILSISLTVKVKVNFSLLYYFLSQQACLFTKTVNNNLKVSGNMELDTWMSMTT